MNKIITLISLLTAVLSLANALSQKRKIYQKIRDTENRLMRELQKVPVKSVFLSPNKEFLKRYTKNSCKSIAQQLETNTFSDDEYGDYSRECAVVVLNALAENMPEGKTLADYFDENDRMRFNNLTLE